MKLKFPYLSACVFALCLALSTHSWSATKRIGIMVFDGVLTSDITAPLEVFGAASKLSWFSDYEVITINVGDQSSITTEEGLHLNVDAFLSAKPALDVLIMPSSYTMDPLLANKSLIAYIKTTATKAEWMASNCSGAFVLAEAGILDDKEATTWAGGEADLAKAYPKVKVQYDRNVVIDDHVITSNGSVVSYEAALALLAKISSQSRADEVKAALQLQRIGRDNDKNGVISIIE